MSDTSRTYNIARQGADWRRAGNDLLELWHALPDRDRTLFDGFPDLVASVDALEDRERTVELGPEA